MAINPITKDIRQTRHKLAGKLGNDIRRIGNETRRNQELSSRNFVKLDKKVPEFPAGRAKKEGLEGLGLRDTA